MGVSKKQAGENRQAIVEASERLFRERGVDGVGLTELMRAAGFTQGGFYNHFSSKEALAAEVVKTAVAEANRSLERQVEPEPKGGRTRLERHVENYLSAEHRRDVARGCSIAGLASDVRRLGGDAQGHFARGLDDLFGTLARVVGDEAHEGDARANREDAIALYCSMVGALLLSRSVAEARPLLADEIVDVVSSALLGREQAPAARRRRLSYPNGVSISPSSRRRIGQTNREESTPPSQT